MFFERLKRKKRGGEGVKAPDSRPWEPRRWEALREIPFLKFQWNLLWSQTEEGTGTVTPEWNERGRTGAGSFFRLKKTQPVENIKAGENKKPLG